jgi:hypothetical protein
MNRAWNTGRRHGNSSQRPSKGLRDNPDYRAGFAHGWAERATLPKSKGSNLGGAGRASGPVIRGLAGTQRKAAAIHAEAVADAQAFVNEINRGG